MATEQKQESPVVQMDKEITENGNKLIKYFDDKAPEIDTSIGDQAIQKIDNNIREKYKNLKELGFERANTVQKVDEASKEEEQEKREQEEIKLLNNKLHILKEDLGYKKSLHPYRILEFSQILSLLHKYDLYLGHSSFFTGEIPEKAADDILKYKKNDFVWTDVEKPREEPITSIIGDKKYEIRALEKNLKEIEGERVGGYGPEDINPTGPLTQNQKRAKELKEEIERGCNKQKEPTFYICAPKDHYDFSDKSTRVVERLLYQTDHSGERMKFQGVPKPNVPKLETDPIIFAPIMVKNQWEFDLQFFHVVTAWGPEAEIPEVYNAQNN